jgi:hypothetical protein
LRGDGAPATPASVTRFYSYLSWKSWVLRQLVGANLAPSLFAERSEIVILAAVVLTVLRRGRSVTIRNWLLNNNLRLAATGTMRLVRALLLRAASAPKSLPPFYENSKAWRWISRRIRAAENRKT